jgi:glycosyltransferase involved in cell wall biosynthesis
MKKIPASLTDFFNIDDLELKDNKFFAETGVKIFRIPLFYFYSGRAIFTSRIFRLVNSINPDVLYIHGNDTLTAIRFLLKLKKIKFAVVMDSHMLSMASKNMYSEIFRFLYRKLITPIIVKNSIPVIRTQDDIYVQRHLGIPLAQCPWISVGTDTQLFRVDRQIRKRVRKEYDILEEDMVAIYAGKLDESKGGYFLAQAIADKFNTDRSYVLLIIGNSSDEYGKSVESIFTLSQNRIIRIPTQKYKDLAKFYQASDFAIFPRQCSLSFYDVQACGLPVIFEDNNINRGRLQGKNGVCFKPGDLMDFRMRIEEMLNAEETEYVKMRYDSINYILNGYNYQDITNRYIDLIDEHFEFFRIKKKKLR